ncbi:MAG: Gfo/Idh/MocA family oxidoreductase [Promethearchaeota archaeon]
MNIGLIGLDTSHVRDICKLLNKGKKSKARITHGFKGGTDDFSLSHTRVEGFTRDVKHHGVEIIDDLEKLADKVDAIIITSCDGRQHLDQFRIIAPFGKPVFIDKPLTCSLKDAKEIVHLSRKNDAPFFSASSVRFARGIHDIGISKDIAFAEAIGPLHVLDDYPGWFWYGVHVVETLFSLLGEGAKDVKVTIKDGIETVYSSWKDNKVGVAIGMIPRLVNSWEIRIASSSGLLISRASRKPPLMKMLMEVVLKFFNTRVSPISEREMLEIVAFIEAINEARVSGAKVIINI